MALKKYNEKRNFNESPEPTGGNPSSEKHNFVIQKHQSSSLHYDFRLEIDGVLKSWAVPKGPSTDPDIKRLAILVEDHPYDYKNFEGVIPSGYGAGTVIIWDQGTFELAESNGANKKLKDKALLQGVSHGKLHIILSGKKLKGEFAIIKTKGKDDNGWLLFKVKDKYTNKEEITLLDKSVVSNKTLDQIAEDAHILTKPKKSSGFVQKEKNEKSKIITAGKLKNADKDAKFPLHLLPMLASPGKPFHKEGWQYEIKWDGYRTLAYCQNKTVELKSRNDNSLNDKFFPIHDALQRLQIQAVLDGEVVVLGENGHPDFGVLQNWKNEKDGELIYYVFDLLWLNGKDLLELTLSERRSLLKELIPENSYILFSENFEVNGLDFIETVKKMGLEGIMAKKSDSPYTPGNRSTNWIKIKAKTSQKMVIGGFTKNASTSKTFSSLLLGVYESGQLIYRGKAGTGFSDKQQLEMLQQFKPLIIKSSPFSEIPDVNKPSRFRSASVKATAVWMKPILVCEASYTEITKEGLMRHPVFEGMISEKKAADVNAESEVKINKSKTPSKTKSSKSREIVSETKEFLNSQDQTEHHCINGNDIKFTNLNKMYWPKEKIRKRDLLNYYHQMAPYILPYLINRPQSMNRHPNGINGENFYFKDVTDTAPSWIETFKYTSDSDDRERNYLVAKDEASILYMANLGCIEMNPWHSTIDKEDYPDWCVIDLDPGEKTFDQVIEAAMITHQILKNMGVDSYPKTSGSSGIHIYIPMAAAYDYEQSKEFALIVATLVQRELPKSTSIERIVKARKGKMYIDYLQNKSHATVAAPYSVRPKSGATVSMPLSWDEVKKGLKISDFTIFNSLERVLSLGDIFKPVLGKGINLDDAIKKFSNKR